MPLILSGNVASATASTGYTVDNSCRFDRGSSDYLSRTNGSAGNRRTFTISFWIKIAEDYSNAPYIFGTSTSTTNITDIYYSNTGAIAMEAYTGAWSLRLTSDPLLRDISAFYHICYAVDTTQATETDRVKLYINGVQSTFNSSPYKVFPSQDLELPYNQDTGGVTINCQANYNAEFMSAYYSEFCMIDGSALAPTSFGEFDEDSPTIWKPIDVSGLTFGDNGFYCNFSDSADLGADSSGNSNDFTVTNLAATDQTTDTPTNNFCTMNPLDNFYAGATFSEGNCKIVTASSTRTWVRSTFGVDTGKWYWEQRLTVESTDSAEDDVVGIVDRATTTALLSLDSSASCPGLVLRENGKIFTYLSGSSGHTVGWNEFEEDDIVMVALDLDNNKIYFGTNGTWGNSSDPAGDSNGFAITHASSGGHDGVFYCAVSILNNNSSNTWEVNFGNPSFTISSSNADADGYGNFEYAVPSGYYALCTKNLAEYG